MTEVELLRRVGTACFGAYGWQIAAAAHLDVNTRTMRRWAAGETAVPAWIWEQLAPLLETKRLEIQELQKELLYVGADA